MPASCSRFAHQASLGIVAHHRRQNVCAPSAAAIDATLPAAAEAVLALADVEHREWGLRG